MANIRLTDVVKQFNKIETIHGVSLDIQDGEFVVFVGPSGCGKSTLLRLISGLEDISAGRIEIGGHDVSYTAPSKRGVAMVFQSYALYPHMTVKENMSFGLKMRGEPLAEINARVSKAAAILQLDQLLDRKPKQLSGGQRQRVAIGRAIVREPQVFLFDEPLSNLDAELRVEMRVQIAKLHETLNTTMVYVTHDQVEAMTLADKIVVLRAGKVEQVGSPMTLYHNPVNLFVAGFIGSPRMNFIDAVVTDIQTDSGTILVTVNNSTIHFQADSHRVKVGEKITIGIRPEHVQIQTEDAFIRLNVKVEVAEHLGGVSYLYCRYLDQPLVVQAPGHNITHAGEQLDVSVHQQDCYLFNAAGDAIIERELPVRSR